MKKLTVVCKGLAVSMLMTVILLMIFAFMMLKLQPDLKIAETGILAVYACSVFSGGWFCGKKIGIQKYLWGMLSGILYFLILLAASVMGDRILQSDITEGMIAFLICPAGGPLGGMFS